MHSNNQTVKHKSRTAQYTNTGYGHVVQHHQRTSSQQFYNLLSVAALAIAFSFGPYLGPYHSARKQKSKISIVHSLAVLKGHHECLKCGKTIWRPGLRPGRTPLGELTALPDPLADGEGLAAPPQELHPALGPSGLQP